MFVSSTFSLLWKKLQFTTAVHSSVKRTGPECSSDRASILKHSKCVESLLLPMRDGQLGFSIIDGNVYSFTPCVWDCFQLHYASKCRYIHKHIYTWRLQLNIKFLTLGNMLSFFKRLYLFIFRERGRKGEREGEKHQCVTASCATPTGDLACNPGMCPDWELNQ